MRRNQNHLKVKLSNYPDPLIFSSAQQRFVSLSADQHRELLALGFTDSGQYQDRQVIDNDYGVVALIPATNWGRPRHFQLTIDPEALEAVEVILSDEEAPALPPAFLSAILAPPAQQPASNQTTANATPASPWNLHIGRRYEITSVTGEVSEVEVSDIRYQAGLILVNNNSMALTFRAFTWREV